MEVVGTGREVLRIERRLGTVAKTGLVGALVAVREGHWSGAGIYQCG